MLVATSDPEIVCEAFRNAKRVAKNHVRIMACGACEVSQKQDMKVRPTMSAGA